MAYSALERRLGQLLDSFPRLRGVAKSAYQRANYYIRGRRRGTVSLHPQAEMAAVGASTADEDDRAYFFGYFGISPWCRSGRYFLLHRLQGGRSPAVEICTRDRDSGETLVLAQTMAWNFQQGSMAQWLNRDGMERVAFNDLVQQQLVCRLLSLDGEESQVPWPIQALHPGGSEAVSINYRRLWRIRPEYGYDVVAQNFSPDQAPHEDGIWRVDLLDGQAELVITLEELAGEQPRLEMEGAEHKVNHIVYSPAGDQFAFMHRWLGGQGKFSRLYCARSDGSERRLLLDHRMVSHYAWRDDNTLLVWARTPENGDRYYLLDVSSGQRRALARDVLDRFGDGHPSFSPDREWLVTDSYPDRARMQHLCLFHCGSSRLVEVGSFFAPWRYEGPVRCDLHPRWSPDGLAVSIDSTHDGVRRSYIIDVSRIVGD